MYRLALLLLVLLPSAASAQAPDDFGKTPSLGDLYIDFAPPELTAFTLVGVAAGRVSTPSTAKALAASLANGLTAEGALEQGVGVEIAPALLWNGGRALNRPSPLDRLSVSLATVRSGDTTRVGLGLRWLAVDGASPHAQTPEAIALRSAVGRSLADLVEAIDAATARDRLLLLERAYAVADPVADAHRLSDAQRDSLAAVLTVSGTLAEGDSLVLAPASVRRALFETTLRSFLGAEAYDALDRSTLDPELEVVYASYESIRGRLTTVVLATARDDAEAAREAFRDATWNAPSLQLAAGWTARADGSEDFFDSVQGEGLQAFVGGPVGAGSWFQSTGHFQARFPVLRGGGDEAIRVTAGTRLLLGSATRRLSAEALYSTEARDAGEGVRLLLGGELRLTDGTYLELATGVNLPDAGPAQLLTLGGLRYALRPARRFDGPGR